MSNKIRAEYIKRPLNNAEREFAALPENHDLIFAYMKCKNLDPEEFYDELILDYLVAVKQYVTEKPDLQINYTFSQVLYQRLNGQMMHYWRKEHSKVRTLEREAFRLDCQYENHKQDRCSRIEPWWIDPMQNVERYVIEKEFLRDIYSNIHRYAEPELMEIYISMKGEGWSDYDIARKAISTLSDYKDWGVRETVQLIKGITSTRYHSPLQRLYRDTLEYGNYEEYQKWEDAHEIW